MKSIDIALQPRLALAWSLGRRVERLLYAGALLVALALSAFYLAFAARHYAEDRASQGIQNLALLIEGDEKVLQRFYELETQRQKLAQSEAERQKLTAAQRQKSAQKHKEKDRVGAADGKDAAGENFYAKALEDKIARASSLSGVDAEALRAEVNASRPPAELVAALRERKKALDAQPATVAGVVVPSSSLATRLPAAFLANLLVVTLAPLVILWLAALRVTRSREKRALESGAEAYPHALNAAALPLEGLVRRHAGNRWPVLDSERLREALLAFLRMALVALLAAPMIAAYVATAATLGLGVEGGWLRALYLVTVIVIMLAQAAALVLAEAPSADEGA